MANRMLRMCMVTFIWALHVDATNRWPERTRKDLKAVSAAIEKYKTVRHDTSTSSEAIFQECLQRASQVQTIADYQAVIAYYVSSFNDDSLKLTFCRAQKKVCWPGFIVTYQHNAYIVAYVSDRYPRTLLPPLGAELIACDGIPVSRYMSDYVKPYRAACESDFVHTVPYVGIYDNNMWSHKISSCTFLVDGKQLMVPLLWRWRARCCLDEQIDELLKKSCELRSAPARPTKQIQLPSNGAILTIT